MHQQTDATASSYYHPYYQNPTGAGDPPPIHPVSASAPPVSAPPTDHSNYYQSFSPNPDHVPNPNQYSFHNLNEASLNHYPNHVNYDYTVPQIPNPNPQSDPSYASNSYDYGSSVSPSPYHVNTFENNPNYGGEQGAIDSGVYKYQGGQVEPAYGGKTTGGGGVMFDDYGRPISTAGEKEKNGYGDSYGNSSPMIVKKAAPKAEDSQDAKSGGVQKFRVKLLSEGFGQIDMDVLCQIGLDGIQILDPETRYTIKIFPLETVARWEVLDSYIFAFWATSSTDPEPKRIRLKSSSYTTNIILDTVTAASIQFKEIGATSDPSDPVKETEQKRGFIDWKNLIKPANEEKEHWVPDEAVTKCTACRTDFNAFNRKHHCRNCGDIFCDKCTQGRIALTSDDDAQPVRVCDQCMAEVTQRMTNRTHTHQDLAKKLQEEMDKKRNKLTGVKPESSGPRTREVACPTCTVHLQIVVPASGSETIECSVCQHPFLVNAT